jgi:hypothetical protein
MVAYGFRLHKLTAHEGMARAELDLGDVGGAANPVSALRSLRDRIESLEGKTIIDKAVYAHEPADLTPPVPSALPRQSTRPYMHIVSHTLSGRKLKVTLDYGREGDFDNILSADNSPRPMDGLAAARTFRVWFIVPPSGTVAYMISETKGQSYAGTALLDRLRVENQRAACTPQGTGLDVGHWVRWKFEDLFDGSRIDDIFRKGENFELEVRRVGHAPSGAPRSGMVKITENGLGGGARVQDAIAAVRGWWNNRGSGTALARSERAARDLGTLIDLNIDFNNLGFNDGEIRFTQEGKVLTINPNKIEKLLVYPMGTVRPNDMDMTKAAAVRLHNVNRDLSLNIDLADLV